MNKRDEEVVASLLRDGQSFQTIKRKVRALCNSKKDPRPRLFHISDTEIRFIADRLNIQPMNSGEDDLTSIGKRVETEDSANVFRFYRPATSRDGHGFLLVMITPTQEQCLRDHANRGIAIDCISDVSQHNLSLATIVIADRYDSGLPGAFLLSKRITQNEVALLFEEVKKVAPCFNPRFYMSDDDPTFFNVFKSVFPNSTTEMSLCSWPVLLSLKRDLSTKLQNMSLFEEAMQHLRKTFKSKTMAKFLECYGLTISFLTKNKEAGMVEYLRSNWNNRAAQWTPLIRPRINTWLFCERWRHRLNTDMVGSQHDTRLDVLVDVLTDTVTKTWELFRHTTKTKMFTNSYRLKQQHSNHSKADEAYWQGHVVKIEAKVREWVVTTRNGVYTVTFVGCDCSEQNYHCREDNCGACPYAYICECIQKNESAEVSCEHVHLACSRATAIDSNGGELSQISFSGPSSGDIGDTTDKPTSSSSGNGLQSEAKEPVDQCSTEFNTNILRLGAPPTLRGVTVVQQDRERGTVSPIKRGPQKYYVPVSTLPSVRDPTVTRRVYRVVPLVPSSSSALPVVMSTQWLIVSTKQHDYSVIPLSEVSSGRISCGSLIKTIDGRSVTIIFIGSSREQCEQYCRKLTGNVEVKSEDISDVNRPSSSVEGLSGRSQPADGLDKEALRAMDAAKSEESKETQNGTACKANPKRSIRVPRSMVLELASTLSGLEDEIRSRFDHLEDLMEETCGRITAIENAIKMEEEEALNISSRGYASSNQSEGPSFDSSRPESSLERDISISDEASGKGDEILFVDERGNELLELLPCDVDEADIDEVIYFDDDQIISEYHGTAESGDNIWTCAEDEEVFCRKPFYPLTMSERAEVVRLSEDRNYKEIAAEFSRLHPDRRPISASCVSKLLAKVKETGSIANRPRSGRPRTSTTEDNAALILECFRRCPTMSIRRMSEETGISKGSIHRILIEHNAKYGK
ncbi:hypothetical protein ANCCAN_07140 [Ancylostoma caninum]|uniref:HTH iclR-type domain-containing protein n=1 Tax=Ancylostoma caninum TaxID=29170 RepID=A0A368GR46_ANCCA|nr:hypothetical protein ANCCAN_07140 [Ancylostoma caninum]